MRAIFFPSPWSAIGYLFSAVVCLWVGNLAAADTAANLFAELCSVCHGLGGKGDGPSAAGLYPKPADFTNCSVMAVDSDEVLFRIIKGGGQSIGRSTVMPSWGDALSDQQIRELLRYVRSLCKK